MRCDTGYNKNHTIATYLGVLLHHTKHRIGQRMYKRMVVEHLPRITERIVLEFRNPQSAIHRYTAPPITPELKGVVLVLVHTGSRGSYLSIEKIVRVETSAGQASTQGSSR